MYSHSGHEIPPNGSCNQQPDNNAIYRYYYSQTGAQIPQEGTPKICNEKQLAICIIMASVAFLQLPSDRRANDSKYSRWRGCRAHLILLRLQKEFALQCDEVTSVLPELHLPPWRNHQVQLCLRMQHHVHHALIPHLQQRNVSGSTSECSTTPILQHPVNM